MKGEKWTIEERVAGVLLSLLLLSAVCTWAWLVISALGGLMNG